VAIFNAGNVPWKHAKLSDEKPYESRELGLTQAGVNVLKKAFRVTLRALFNLELTFCQQRATGRP